MKQVMNPINSESGRFKDGNPQAGEYGTIVTAQFLNDVQDSLRNVQQEVISVLNDAGIVLDDGNVEQLLEAIKRHVGQVESIEALRATEPFKDRQMVNVKSYYANSTTGGGVFLADFSDSATADNGGTVIVTAMGKRWKRIFQDRLTLEDFGAKADGVFDNGEIINRAMLTCAYLVELHAGKGVYLTNQELRAPSGTRLMGAGMDSTIIKAGPLLPAQANLFTNISNNYAKRMGKDRDIDVRNLSFDADWRGRYQVGDTINNQACGVKMSAVAASYFYKVKSSNAALHCFDVCADQYVNTGNVTDTSDNPSENVVFDQCEAWNPYRDDGFTTHNCGGVVFNACRAYHDNSVSQLSNTQHGFEADEGSFDIAFNDCKAFGFVCGYQSKGHASTMPAHRVKFRGCLATECGFGFMVSVGTNPTGKAGYIAQSAKIEDCAVEKPNSNHADRPYSLYIYGADGVEVDGFTVNGNGKISLKQGCGRVSLQNIVFNDLIENEEHGCIHIESTVSNGLISLKNISSTVEQRASLVAKTHDKTVVMIENAFLKGSGEHGIYLNRNPRDVFINSLNTGYANTVYLSVQRMGLKGDCALEAYNQTYLFGNAENAQTAQTQAPVGTVMFNANNGKSWRQVSSNLAEPKWVKEVTFEEGGVRLNGLTVGENSSTSRNFWVNGSSRMTGGLMIGEEGSTTRNFVVNGGGLINGGLTVGKDADQVGFKAIGYAQAQTPPEGENSDKLATTKWVTRRLTPNRNDYHRTIQGTSNWDKGTEKNIEVTGSVIVYPDGRIEQFFHLKNFRVPWFAEEDESIGTNGSRGREMLLQLWTAMPNKITDIRAQTLRATGETSATYYAEGCEWACAWNLRKQGNSKDRAYINISRFKGDSDELVDMIIKVEGY